MIPNLETKCVPEWVHANQALQVFVGTEELDLSPNGPLWHPKLEVQRACFDVCVWQGMAMLCKADMPPGAIVHPFIARAAIPEMARRLHTTTVMTQVLAPSGAFVYPFGKNRVLTLEDATKHFDDVHIIFAATYAMDASHQALHNGVLLPILGQEGLTWAPLHFCPEYHKLGQYNGELANELSRKKHLFAVLHGSEYIEKWAEAFATSGIESKPWWLTEQLADLRALVKPDQNYRLN